MAGRPKQKKVKLSRAAARVMDKKNYGDEPNWNYPYHIPNIELIKIFNWYQYMIDTGTRVEFLYDYIEVHQPHLLKMLKTIKPEFIPSGICWAARLLTRGLPLQKEIHIKILAETKALIEKYYLEEEPQEEKQDSSKTNERLSTIIGDFEELLDKGELNCYQYLTTNSVPRSYIQKIIEYYTPIVEEIRSISTDVQLKEGYKSYTKPQQRALLAVYETLLSDCSKYVNNKSITRKPRAKKKVSVDKLVSGLKYMERFDELKMVSKNPVSIIGAKELWLYDTRYKVCIHFVSTDGFSVKGTTLLNISSSEKWNIGRKSAQFAEAFPSKSALKSFLKTLKEPNVDVTPRINQNMIILKAI